MDMIQRCMIISWTYLESSSFILFASNLKWLVTKMPEGIFSQLCFYAYFTRVSQQKVKTHIIFRKCLLKDKSLSSGNLLIALLIGEVVSPPTPIFVYLSQDLCQHTMRSAIFMINKHIYNHPFKKFMSRKYKGVKISSAAMLERPIDSGDFSYEHGFDVVFIK